VRATNPAAMIDGHACVFPEIATRAGDSSV
jgi:hypothetical protein